MDRDLVVTTLQAYSPTLADNVLKHNALLSRLKEKGNIDLLDGGDFLEENLMMAENATFKWYSGFELLEVTSNPVLTSARFEWKQANANVVISGREKRQNKGSKTRKHNLIEARIKVAEKTMQNGVGASVFSDGTGFDGKELTGLRALISDAPASGVVGGIDRAAYPFWRNQMYSFNAEAGIADTPTPDQMLAAMNAMWLRCKRGTDLPDLIICDINYYGIYEKALQVIQRISESDRGNSGYRDIEFKKIPVIYDANCPANHMYFINTDYLKLKVHEDANFALDEQRLPFNQDAEVYPLLFMGNITVSNCNLQGIIKA